jgi:hypothetical protein
VKVEAAFWDDSGVQRLTTDQQAEIGRETGPIAAFGAYVGDPDAEESLFFERVLG